MHFGKEVEFDHIKTVGIASEMDRLFHSTAVRHYMNHPSTYKSINHPRHTRGLSDGTSLITQTYSGSLSRFLVRGCVFLHRCVSGCPDRPATGEWV